MSNLPIWLEEWNEDNGFTLAQWDAIGGAVEDCIDAMLLDPTGKKQKEFERRYGSQALDVLIPSFRTRLEKR